MTKIDEDAVRHVRLVYGVDLHDWLVSPELPLHGPAVACMQIAGMVLTAEGLARWQSMNDLIEALRVVVEPFRPTDAQVGVRKPRGNRVRSQARRELANELLAIVLLNDGDETRAQVKALAETILNVEE